MRRVAIFQRPRLITVIALSVSIFVTGCGLNKPTLDPPVVATVPIYTLAPIISTTPKYTATLPPTDTPIPLPTDLPSETPPEPTISPTPTLSPTPSIRGVINTSSSSGTANMRSGPGEGFPIVQSVKAGTSLTVLYSNDAKSWYFVTLDDGTEGWVTARLLTVSNEGVVAALSDADLTKQVQDTVFGTPGAVAAVATRPAGTKKFNDVLAYCDHKDNGEPRKTLATGTNVTIYWSWFAKTPEQLKDHIDNAIYEVKVDGQTLQNWQQYMSSVGRDTYKGDKVYIVYWYIPIGTPSAGEHKIDFSVTWKQKISDGYQDYGPGTAQTSDTGTCAFTIKG